MTSIDSAAMAMIATIANATRIIVTPCSCRREHKPCDWLEPCSRITGDFMTFAQFSFMATATAVIVGGNSVDLPRRLATLPNLQA